MVDDISSPFLSLETMFHEVFLSLETMFHEVFIPYGKFSPLDLYVQVIHYVYHLDVLGKPLHR